MLKLNLTQVYIVATFFNLASWLLMRCRKYFSLRRDDGRQVMTIAYKHLWPRWCNVSISFWRLHSIINCDNNKSQGSLMIGRSSNYCLASIEQYYSYIQDQNKFINIYIEKRAGMGSPGQWLLFATEKE